VLHIDNHEPEAAIQAAKWANEAGIIVLMDAGSVRHRVIDLLEHVDVLIASHRFGRDCTGVDNPMKAAESMLSGRRKISIITCGEDGCACATPEERFHVPAFKVDVVDTTGAGDVFHGAFSFGLAKGWNAREVATFASAVAAIKCGSLGGRQGIPTYEETISFLKQHGQAI
jgi:ribokinase